jgi:hypothetical protein
MVGVNLPIPVPMAFHSSGGWKRSLLGDGRWICLLNDGAAWRARHPDRTQGLSPGAVILGAIG